MLLEKLALHRFRSYHDIDLAFPAAGAYITGLNGSGKTNLLESIFFLANLSSFRTSNREELRNWDAAQGIVKASAVKASWPCNCRRARDACGSMARKPGIRGNSPTVLPPLPFIRERYRSSGAGRREGGISSIGVLPA